MGAECGTCGENYPREIGISVMKIIYKIIIVILNVVFHIFFRFKVEGRGNLPQGATIICANHRTPMDPVFLAAALGTRTKPYFMAKAELCAIPVIGKLLMAFGVFPVKRGASDINAIKTSLKVLGGGDKLIMFPEGTRVGEDVAAEAKTGVSMLAYKTGAYILPVYMKVKSVRLFGKIIVRFGEPIKVAKEKATAEQYRQLADTVMERINGLGA